MLARRSWLASHGTILIYAEFGTPCRTRTGTPEGKGFLAAVSTIIYKTAVEVPGVYHSAKGAYNWIILCVMQKQFIAELIHYLWCQHQGLNSGHPAYKAGALPTELYRQLMLERIENFEISTPWLETRCSASELHPQCVRLYWMPNQRFNCYYHRQYAVP